MTVTAVATGDDITAAMYNTKLEAPITAAELASFIRKSIIGGNMAQSTVAAATTNYTALFGTTFTGTENNVKITTPYACQFTFFGLRTSTTQPTGGALLIYLRKNGVDTALALNIPAGTAAGLTTATSTGVAFAANDEISIKIVNNATGAASAGIVGFSLGYEI